MSLRHLVARDLGSKPPQQEPSVLFDPGSSGGSNIVKDQDAMIAVAFSAARKSSASPCGRRVAGPVLRNRIHRKVADLFWEILRSGVAVVEPVGAADLEVGANRRLRSGSGFLNCRPRQLCRHTRPRHRAAASFHSDFAISALTQPAPGVLG